jgi:aspartyl protease family protein
MSPRLFWIALAVLGAGLLILIATDDAGTVAGFGSDAFGQTLYYGLWGAVLGAGILGSGIRLGEAVRSIAIWAVIIVLLMAGYQYRYELQDIASRVTAGLVPGSPVSLVDTDGRAAVMLERLAGGHFEARGEVNGSAVRFIVDTGATATVLTEGDARAAGIDPDRLSFSAPILTANGQAMAARATADEIRIGEITRARVPVMVVQSGLLDRSLLGMNFIGTLSGFDMRGERLILRD